MIHATRSVSSAGSAGTYQPMPDGMPGSTSAHSAPDRSGGLQIGDPVKVSILRRTEHAPAEHIVCDGVVRFLGRRWIGVRYRIGNAELNGGFWPEEVRRA